MKHFYFQGILLCTGHVQRQEGEEDTQLMARKGARKWTATKLKHPQMERLCMVFSSHCSQQKLDGFWLCFSGQTLLSSPALRCVFCSVFYPSTLPFLPAEKRCFLFYFFLLQLLIQRSGRNLEIWRVVHAFAFQCLPFCTFIHNKA